MKSTDPHWRYQRVIRKLEPDGKVLRCSDLQGGVSAQATLVEFGVPDRAPEKVVVRRFGEADLRRNPDLAYDQFSLMLSLRRAGLAVPIPYLPDASDEIFAAPYLVLEYIEGSTELAPSEVESGINQLAEYLAEIHKIPGTDRAVSRLPKFEDICAAELRRPKAYSSDSSPKGAWDRASEDPAKGSTEDFADEERIREILLAVMPLPQRNSPALLHGDYWPGNVVWQGGRIAAVIDWEDTAVGDPLPTYPTPVEIVGFRPRRILHPALRRGRRPTSQACRTGTSLPSDWRHPVRCGDRTEKRSCGKDNGWFVDQVQEADQPAREKASEKVQRRAPSGR